MNGKRLFAGYIGGWIALLIELGFFGGSIVLDMLGGIFPESTAQLSSMLSNMATLGLLIDLITGALAAFNIGGWRDEAFGFLAGILTVIILFGGLLSFAPQILDSLWVEFLAVLLPIVIVVILAIVIGLYQERQEYSEQGYYY